MPNTQYSVNKFGAAWVIISISTPTESLSCLWGGIKSRQVFNYIIPSPSVLIHVISFLSNSFSYPGTLMLTAHTPQIPLSPGGRGPKSVWWRAWLLQILPNVWLHLPACLPSAASRKEAIRKCGVSWMWLPYGADCIGADTEGGGWMWLDNDGDRPCVDAILRDEPRQRFGVRKIYWREDWIRDQGIWKHLSDAKTSVSLSLHLDLVYI